MLSRIATIRSFVGRRSLVTVLAIAMISVTAVGTHAAELSFWDSVKELLGISTSTPVAALTLDLPARQPAGPAWLLSEKNSSTMVESMFAGRNFFAPCGTDPNLVGCWQFSEGSGTTAADGSGNGNTGTLVGDTIPNPMWTADRFGNPSQALHFNGTSQYVKVPDSTSLDITGDITIALWVKPENVITQYVLKRG
ncbi:MAG: hypothetical protein IPI76_16845 [Chloracidobacterium sp.]|nr:hypothetical protein [Chloracidobacterium sp.]